MASARRERGASGESADDGHEKREDENERLRDHHQLDVGLEAVPDLGHGAEEVERAEERVKELPHARPPPSLERYFRTGTLVNGSHLFWSRVIVPLARRVPIALSRNGLNLLPFSMTAP